MASRLAGLTAVSFLFCHRAAAHGLNRGGLQSLDCHDCVLPLTLKACCRSDCERTLVRAHEQLLVRLDPRPAAAGACEHVIFYSERTHSAEIGAINLSRAITVGIYIRLLRSAYLSENASRLD